MEEESQGRETAPPPPAPQTTDLEDTYALVALQGGGGEAEVVMEKMTMKKKS